MLLIAFAASANTQQGRKYWVLFSDKGHTLPSTGSLAKSSEAYQLALTLLTSRALARRAKVLPTDAIVDAQDLPLYDPYIEGVQVLGGVIVHEIRWMNAVSVLLTSTQASEVRRLPFVESVQPVTIYREKRNELSPQRIEPFDKASMLDYGPSLTQLQTIDVPAVHNLGVTGKGVLVGMFDTGFRWRAHDALKTRHVVAEHDFIFNRDTTANGPDDSPDQDEHGTLTMSVLGGYEPGQLIGAAFDVDFALAKTEYVPGGSLDYHWEEDNWAKAVEWADSLGVDVISSSLGYNTFVDGVDYTWDNGDFNGRTSVTAKAALRAARVGIVVCSAMGNEGNGDGVRGTMLTPADADSIVSVGAVDFSDVLAGFSSTGPTNDGRIKPDVVAPGVSVYGASTTGPSAYWRDNGTSLSTPLAGGSAALLLSVRPELTPIQVRDTLRSTADPITDAHEFPSSPNNFTGWGEVNALRATLSVGPIFSNEPVATVANGQSIITTTVVSKFGIEPDSVILHYAFGPDSVFSSIAMTLDSSMMFPTSGKYLMTIPPQPIGLLVRFYISAGDSAGNSYQSPPPIRNTCWQIRYGLPVINPPSGGPSQYVLYQNFPNPFLPQINVQTSIPFDLPQPSNVRIELYDLLGQRVKQMNLGYLAAGAYDGRAGHFPAFMWNGRDESDRPLASGIYFYRITTPAFAATRKMVLLR